MAMEPAPLPLARERAAILAALLLLAAAAWVLVIWQATAGGSMTVSLTMGMSAPLFLAVWVAMMVAMMFPAAAPMILVFARASDGKRQRGRAFVPTWVFVAGYMLVWAAAGVIAYAAAVGADRLAGQSIWLMDNARRIGGAVLVIAGLYQFSPVKDRCLSKCRTPLSFVIVSWRDGRSGALRMGLEHGAYCLGCCWLLFVILFPLGVMNVAAMAAITLVVFAEKALPWGRQAAAVAAAALIVSGAAVLLQPALLPTTLGM